MRILVEVIDPGGVEAASPALDAMHGIALLQQQLRQVAAVLAGDACDQGMFAVAHDCHCHLSSRCALRHSPAWRSVFAIASFNPSVMQGIGKTRCLLVGFFWGMGHLLEQYKLGTWRTLLNLVVDAGLSKATAVAEYLSANLSFILKLLSSFSQRQFGAVRASEAYDCPGELIDCLL